MSFVKDIVFSSISNISCLLLTCILVLYVYYNYISYRRILKLIKNIPGPKGYPIVGNTFEFKGNSPENTWRHQRKMIAPTFHTAVLKTFVDCMNKQSQITVQRLKEIGEKTFDCNKYMSKTTVEILSETVMGVPIESDDSSRYVTSVLQLHNCIHTRYTKPWLMPDFVFNLSNLCKRQEKILDFVHGLSEKIFKKSRDKYINRTAFNLEKENEDENVKTVETLILGSSEQNNKYIDEMDLIENDIGCKKRKPFLDSLMHSLHTESGITEQEVKDQIDTLLLEGHDTTGATCSFFLSLMGIHQDVQKKIMNELDGIFQNSNRPITFNDTLRMSYLEKCILETLRLYPPVPLLGRKMKKDAKLVSGDYTIPAGCTVLVGTYWLHRNPDIYPDPHKFNPDHHTPENAAKRHYYSYLPFSAGARSCVGRKYAMLKLKIVLANVIRNFRIFSDIKESDFRLQSDLVLKRAEGFNIRLKPREGIILN